MGNLCRHLYSICLSILLYLSKCYPSPSQLNRLQIDEGIVSSLPHDDQKIIMKALEQVGLVVQLNGYR